MSATQELLNQIAGLRKLTEEDMKRRMKRRDHIKRVATFAMVLSFAVAIVGVPLGIMGLFYIGFSICLLSTFVSVLLLPE